MTMHRYLSITVEKSETAGWKDGSRDQKKRVYNDVQLFADVKGEMRGRGLCHPAFYIAIAALEGIKTPSCFSCKTLRRIVDTSSFDV